MSDWFTYPERKIYLEDVRFNHKDITLIVAWFVADSLTPQNVYAIHVYLNVNDVLSVIYF